MIFDPASNYCFGGEWLQCKKGFASEHLPHQGAKERAFLDEAQCLVDLDESNAGQLFTNTIGSGHTDGLYWKVGSGSQEAIAPHCFYYV